jgi:Region found in RelA / SpoT proteins
MKPRAGQTYVAFAPAWPRGRVCLTFGYRLRMRMSNGEINRLGDRLRMSSAVGAGDLEQLQELRRAYESALHDAQARIAAELDGIAVPTSRLKTVQTLVGKLRREPNMNLSQVQDVAGIRIVREMPLPEQSRISERIADMFAGSRTIDRRVKPSFGYRAVHVVVKVDGLPVEVQVRTAMQDRWAQIVERMADHWGRQIRYGLPPDFPGERVGVTSRRFVVDLVQRLGPLIESCEESSSGRQLKIRGDLYCQEVANVLREIARLPVLGSTA